MKIKPNDQFNYIRADEVAECWDSIDMELYRRLWAIVKHQKEIPNIEDSGPHDHIGHENLASHWHRLDEADQLTLNNIAEERDRKYLAGYTAGYVDSYFDREGQGPREDYKSGKPAEREPNE